jgi:hypothetical protein
MACHITSMKLISRLRPNYLEGPPAPMLPHFDPVLERDVCSVDLAHLFWDEQFSKLRLGNYLNREPVESTPAAAVRRELDQLAIAKLTHAKQTLADISMLLPPASSLFVAFRVLSRCATIASRTMTGCRYI